MWYAESGALHTCPIPLGVDAVNGVPYARGLSFGGRGASSRDGPDACDATVLVAGSVAAKGLPYRGTASSQSATQRRSAKTVLIKIHHTIGSDNVDPLPSASLKAGLGVY